MWFYKAILQRNNLLFHYISKSIQIHILFTVDKNNFGTIGISVHGRHTHKMAPAEDILLYKIISIMRKFYLTS